MIITLHGLSTMHCNIKTEIRLAKDYGFGGIELVESQLLRYIESGQNLGDINVLLSEANVKAVCINALKNIEVQGAKERDTMLKQCAALCKAAREIGCPTVQIVPFCSLDGRPISEVLLLTSMNVKAIADIGAEYGIRFQLEPIAFSAINSIKLSLELIKMSERGNIGMVIDFWHLSAGGGTAPSDVAALDKDMIYGVHFCDGMMKKPGEEWNESALRSYLPGEGEVDVASWVTAVKSTGYDWSWSSELYSPYHWEMDMGEIASKTKQLMEKYII